MDELILEDIYHASEELRAKIKPNEAYEKLKKEAEKYYDKLFEVLDGELEKWLDEIWFLDSGMQSEWGYVNFRAGLLCGLRLMAQAFTDSVSEQDINIDEKTPPA